VVKISLDLANEVKSNLKIFIKIFKSSLKVKKEHILIISDQGTEESKLAPMMAYGYYLAAKKKNLSVDLVFQGVKKGFMSADEITINYLEKIPSNSIIILALSQKLGTIGLKRSFRTFCQKKGHRFISSSGLGNAKTKLFTYFMESININHQRMHKKALEIKKKLDKAKIVRVKTKLGTDLTIDITDMESRINSGNYFNPGEGGNIPAGEVYIAPRGKYNVNGILFIDGSIRTLNGGLLLQEPLKLIIKDGRIIDIIGLDKEILEETFKAYEDRAKYPNRVRLVGEFGIGINPKAVLVGTTVLDEKVMGTAHLGIGSNYWFGGEIKTIFHGDQVFKNPEIYLDDKKLKY
jgi:hypothetical protein